MIRRLLIITACTLAVAQVRAPAQSDPVRVFASNGVRPVLQKLTQPAEAAIARPLATQFSTTTAFKQKIDAGESFDIAILTAEAIDGLIKSGKITAGSRADIGSVGIGIGIRAGAKKPDIGTVEAIKQTLLNAKAITYAGDGASRPHIEKMFDELGITQNVKPKTMLLQGSDASMAAVADGKAELVITLISEIMPTRGIELAGPLPTKFQNYVQFAAGIGANTKNSDAASAYIRFLTDSKVASTFAGAGFNRRVR